MLEELQLWIDPLPREGPEAMAVDEWLWMGATMPILRVYRWAGDWMSLGYFGSCSSIPAGRSFVRRPTGGGVVDHRHDWTYTLIVPRGMELAEMPGNQSYQVIHQALAAVLAHEYDGIVMAAADAQGVHDFCFQRPVTFDLVDRSGDKISGAGQRRGRQGLLHQGSVALPSESSQRSHALARALSRHVNATSIDVDRREIDRICQEKYRSEAWNRKKM